MRRPPIAALAMLALASGCRARPGAAPEPSSLAVRVSGCKAVRLAPSAAGSSARQAVCEVERGSRLRAWLRTPPEASVTARLDGAPLAILSIVPAGEGVRATFELPDGDVKALEIEAEIPSHPPAGAVHALGRVALAISPPLPALDAARAARRGGHLEEALAAARQLAEGSDEAVRLQSVRLQARLERDLGRLSEAAEQLERAAAADRAAARISDEIDDRLALVHLLLTESHDLRHASRVLGEIDAAEVEALYPDGAARVPYFEGLLAHQSGDLAAAGRRFRRSSERSAILGLAAQEADARCMEADALVFLGRSREAARLLDDSLSVAQGSAYECQRAHLLTNRGYALLRMAPDERRAALGRTVDVMEPLLEAVRLYEKPACHTPTDLANALTNVALGELDHDHWSAAERYLAKAKQALSDADDRLAAAWLEIEGRIDLADPARRGDAGQRFASLLRTAASRNLPEAELTAAAGLAAAVERQGGDGGGARSRARPAPASDALPDARAAWDDVERVLERTSRRLPVGEGRDSYLDRAQRIAGLRIDYLLRTRPPAEAAAAARRSRSRLLRSLASIDELVSLPPERRLQRDQAFGEMALARQERAEASAQVLRGNAGDTVERTAPRNDAERRSQEADQRYRDAVDRALAMLAPSRDAGELRPPADGELLLVYHRAGDGWAGFAVEPHATTAARIGRIDSDEPVGALAQRLLGPFAPAIDRARRLRVAASGLVSDIDLHALPWKGRLLIEQLPVAWTLDLPHGEVPSAGSHTAILVGTPSHDWGTAPAAAALAQADEELGQVERALGGRGWMVRRLAGSDVTRAALRGTLEGGPVGLLHYAGHAFVSRDPWDSGLPLAGADWLTVADVTALERGPQRVVLSACQSASADERRLASGLGLAQAFLLRGTGQVVATTRPVPDAVAADLMTRMFAGAGIAGAPQDHAERIDLVEALARAQRQMAEQEPHGEWSAFRVLVP